ncbi:MAG: N-6 DNA methylase [Dehalococcoidia bacterium]|nr:N-6 DNA methylase [Dehalococcoidia bacterium]
MNTLNIKPNHQAVKKYYNEISRLSTLGSFSEGAVSPAFANLLRYCASQFNWTLVEQYPLKANGHPIIVDGALVDSYNLTHGIWEAKDISDDLEKEAKKKFARGYPKYNILFQSPNRAIIWQGAQKIFDEDISKPDCLIDCLRTFFEYPPPALEQWGKAVEEFRFKVHDLATGLLKIIRGEYQTNQRFIEAFNEFIQLCRTTINPNISIQAVEEMLIQHILTERIFRKVFNNPDFVRRNAIARELEKVVVALTSQSFSRDDFMKSLDRFYIAIEAAAGTTDDFAQKQGFLNSVYEKFFQGFSVKSADILGIVYTPQPIVNFMVKSVAHILEKEFGCSLSDEDVHILDPFVGTGSFIVSAMRSMQRSKLPCKYKNDIHCNEVMLLPYYIASMNIEHQYYELIGLYDPFEGICLVDTFELAEGKQLSLLTEDNTARVERQQKAPIFIIIGNPPYNAGQVNENDNNKNRKYPAIDKRVSQTYGKGSRATLLRKLNDPYVKAIRWASDRIGDKGIVALVTNSSFIDSVTFDGMRSCLERDFDTIYVLDLGGNVRKNPKLSGTTHNVFGIQVGVSINILVKRQTDEPQRQADIYYTRLDEFWRKEERYSFLNEKQDSGNIKWNKIQPDAKHNWLAEGMHKEFESFVPMGSKESKFAKNMDVPTIFRTFSLGVSTNRDNVVYDFVEEALVSRVEQFCYDYNAEVARYQQRGRPPDIDSFVDYGRVQWSSTLKNHAKRGTIALFDKAKIRESIYLPFTRKLLYYDFVLIDRPALFGRVFPNIASMTENRVLCVSGIGGSKPFHCLMTNIAPCLDTIEKTQCFPFYTYNADGTNPQENITDWALEQFRTRYKDERISKWDIFHYVYAILHHPQYRQKYAANLKQELPRIPFAAEFWKFAEAGAKLAELHVNYEEQAEYRLMSLETKNAHLTWRVEKMKLSTDKTQIIYNDFLTLGGIPSEVLEYRLGNRSALEWVIDQYQIKTDKRSGIVNDPNRLDDPQYTIRLIGKVITVSLETVKIVNSLHKNLF